MLPRAWPWIAFALALLLEIALFRPIVADYQPTDDELALIADSTDFGGPAAPQGWIHRGFADYFKAYPEWRYVPSDFFRPAANGLYWLCYRLFGDQWTAQLELGYLVHALIVGLIVWFASRRLDLRNREIALVAASAILNPAFWSRYNNPYSVPLAIQFPIYHAELLVALLAILGMLALLAGRLGWFALCLSIAVLFKETALTVPISGILIVDRWRGATKRESLRNAALILAPVLMWLFIKFAIFESGSRIYVFDVGGPAIWLRQVLRNQLFWPSGLFDAALGEFGRAAAGGEVGRLVELAARFGLNLAWLGCLALAAWASLRPRLKQGIPQPGPAEAALLIALGNLVLVALVPATDLRYGYLWFALAPMSLLALLRSRPLAHGVAMVLVASLAGLQIPGILQSFSSDSIESYRMLKQSARALVARLAELPASTKVAFVVDELSNKHVTARYLAKFAGFNGEVVFVFGDLPVTGCRGSAASFDHRYRLSGSGSNATLLYHPARCLEVVDFIPHERLAPDHSIERGAFILYRFPQLTLAEPAAQGGGPARFDLGEEAIVSVRDPRCGEPGNCVWLGFDEDARDYRRIAFQPE